MSQRKPIFFTADLHIGHKNSILFDNRPFRDLDHMHQVIINNYNAIVPENGLCYFLGDIGLANTELLKSVIDKLNGTKVLVLGNHDKKHNAMYSIGFDVVLNGAVLQIAGERVTMSHCPLQGIFREDTTGMRNSKVDENWYRELDHVDFSFPKHDGYHIHGHLHSKKGETILGKQMDVGIVGNDFRPVSISKIESWISRNKS